MKFVVFSILVSLSLAEQNLDVNLGDLPMQNPDLFQGDILGFEPGDRTAHPDETTRWTNREVHYHIDFSLQRYTSLIEKAMAEYNENTCVKFTPRSDEKNYIHVFAGQGCYSNVGMIGGQQKVSLGQGCMFKGTIIHELGHALGFFHEQNRSDRDQYILIYWQNIQSGMETQFFLLKPHENLLINDFDISSIMMYGETAFSKDGRSKTMVAKSGQKLMEVYDKSGLSASDVERIKQIYKC